MTQWLSAEQQRAWRSFLGLHRSLMSTLARELDEHSALSMPDFEVLVMLTDEASGELRITELADKLEWERSRLSHHLTRMEKRGLIERRPCPDDARGSFARVTGTGREAIQAAAPGHVADVRRLLVDALTAEELNELGRISAKAQANVVAGSKRPV